jgi:hypothetical protein
MAPFSDCSRDEHSCQGFLEVNEFESFPVMEFTVAIGSIFKYQSVKRQVPYSFNHSEITRPRADWQGSKALSF